MTLDEVVAEEQALRFPAFNADVVWRLGASVRSELISLGASAAFDIFRNGRSVFFFETDGASQDLSFWIERKRSTVLRFERSSLSVALAAREGSYDFHERFRLPRESFLAGAGGVPILTAESGMVAIATLSGLTGTEDHDLIVRHIRSLIESAV